MARLVYGVVMYDPDTKLSTPIMIYSNCKAANADCEAFNKLVGNSPDIEYRVDAYYFMDKDRKDSD